MPRVAVTGVQAGTSPAAGVAVARCLAAHSGFEIVGVDYSEYATGLQAQDLFFDTAVLSWSECDEVLAEQWLDLCSSRAIELILPCLDRDVASLSRVSSVLEARGIRVAAPPVEAVEATRKSHLQETCEARGLIYPRTSIVGTLEELKQLLAVSEFPLMVKGPASGAFVAADQGAALARAAEIRTLFGSTVLVQELIEGNQYSVAAAVGCDGRPLGTIVVNKLGLDSHGKTWMGVTVANSRIELLATEFMEALQWRGAYELDLIVNGQDIYIVDVNPRFPAWIDGVSRGGQNLPSILVGQYLGLKAMEAVGSAAPPGAAFVRDFADYPVPLAELAALMEGETRRTRDDELYWRL